LALFKLFSFTANRADAF
jgi:hypothetical protein